MRDGCAEQSLKIGLISRPVGERQMFEACPFDRLERVQVAEFDVDAAELPLLQLRPQSGLQKRCLSRARFAAQHPKPPLLVADSLKTFLQVLVALEMREDFGVFVTERQQ